MTVSGGTPAGAFPLSKAIERYFQVALYLLVFTGFGTLASTGGLDLPTVLLVSAALLLRGYHLATGNTFAIGERWTTLLTLIYVAFYLADYFLISGSFLTATVHLVLFVMVVRMFSAQRDRDHYFLAAISFLMLLASALLTVDSVFLGAFAGFILVAVAAFILMEMRHATMTATVQAKEAGAHRRLAWSVARISPVLMVLILAGASAIFFILPRVSAGYLSSYAPSGVLTTGFSEQVQLGRIGQIQQSSAVVMHIQIDGDDAGAYDLKWRGVALSSFDGRTWSNPHEQVVVPRMVDGSFALWQPERRWQGLGQPQQKALRAIHYRVLTEPIGASVFFLAAVPQTMEGNYGLISMDGGGAVYDLDPQHPVGRYEATSNLAQPMPGELRRAAGTPSADFLRTYLQLPRALDTRIPELAGQITAAAGNNYDKSVAIEQYLRSHFAYTLELPRTVARDPLAQFLFERKRGHCEYFASSMAVMLRSLSIPARIVNGFRTGEFNDLTSQYVVRAANAHSWVEAYFPGYGWIAFDPTPAAQPEAQTGWHRIGLYADAAASFWREWVINYDVSHQQTLGQQASRKSRWVVEQARHWAHRKYFSLLGAAKRVQRRMAESPRQWSLAGGLIAVTLVLLANARRLWRMIRTQRLARHPENSPRLAAAVWYERMTRLTARRGWEKSPTQTPTEFLAAIEDRVLQESVAQFTRHYEHARFGDSAEDAGRLPELYEIISAASQKS